MTNITIFNPNPIALRKAKIVYIVEKGEQANIVKGAFSAKYRIPLLILVVTDKCIQYSQCHTSDLHIQLWNKFRFSEVYQSINYIGLYAK